MVYRWLKIDMNEILPKVRKNAFNDFCLGFMFLIICSESLDHILTLNTPTKNAVTWALTTAGAAGAMHLDREPRAAKDPHHNVSLVCKNEGFKVQRESTSF